MNFEAWAGVAAAAAEVKAGHQAEVPVGVRAISAKLFLLIPGGTKKERWTFDVGCSFFQSTNQLFN